MDEKIEEKVNHLLDVLLQRTQVSAIQWEQTGAGAKGSATFVVVHNSATIALFDRGSARVEVQIINPDGLVALSLATDREDLSNETVFKLRQLSDAIRNAVNKVSTLLDKIISEIEEIPPF